METQCFWRLPAAKGFQLRVTTDVRLGPDRTSARVSATLSHGVIDLIKGCNGESDGDSHGK